MEWVYGGAFLLGSNLIAHWLLRYFAVREYSRPRQFGIGLGIVLTGFGVVVAAAASGHWEDLFWPMAFVLGTCWLTGCMLMLKAAVGI